MHGRGRAEICSETGDCPRKRSSLRLRPPCQSILTIRRRRNPGGGLPANLLPDARESQSQASNKCNLQQSKGTHGPNAKQPELLTRASNRICLLSHHHETVFFREARIFPQQSHHASRRPIRAIAPALPSFHRLRGNAQDVGERHLRQLEMLFAESGWLGY